MEAAGETPDYLKWDIYAFGALLLALFSGNDLPLEHSEKLQAKDRLDNSDLKSLIDDCLSLITSARPSAEDLVTRLCRLRNTSAYSSCGARRMVERIGNRTVLLDAAAD